MKPITTAKFIVFWALEAVLFEGWTFINKTPKDTISETVWEWAKHLLIVRFATAFLFAHLFFQRDESAKDDKFWRFVKKYPVTVTYLGLFCGYVAWQKAEELAKTTTES